MSSGGKPVNNRMQLPVWVFTRHADARDVRIRRRQ
jgi:hypothetical protein